MHYKRIGERHPHSSPGFTLQVSQAFSFRVSEHPMHLIAHSPEVEQTVPTSCQNSPGFFLHTSTVEVRHGISVPCAILRTGTSSLTEVRFAGAPRVRGHQDSALSAQRQALLTSL